MLTTVPVRRSPFFSATCSAGDALTATTRKANTKGAERFNKVGLSFLIHFLADSIWAAFGCHFTDSCHVAFGKLWSFAQVEGVLANHCCDSKAQNYDAERWCDSFFNGPEFSARFSWRRPIVANCPRFVACSSLFCICCAKKALVCRLLKMPLFSGRAPLASSRSSS